MNVHKTFRKCSGRILNTLCPINLYLLIRGGQNDSKNRSRVSLFLYCSVFVLKQFHVNVPFLYILETSANQTFSDVCRGVYIYEILVRNWLIENMHLQLEIIAQLKFTCSKSTIETVGKCVKYIQSYQ